MSRSGQMWLLTAFSALFGVVAVVVADPVATTSKLAFARKTNNGDSTNDTRPFAERYAEASLRLAKIDLQKAIELNKRVPNTFSPVALQPLEQAVDLAQQWYDDVRKAVADPLYASYVRGEEAALMIAEAEYQKARAADERFPGTTNPDELERLRLTAEVARLRYTRALDSASEPESARLAWQVEQLREEMIRLRARVEQLRRIN